jgi:beta-lactamase class C
MNHNDLLKEKNVALPHRRNGKSWRATPLTDNYYNAVLAGGINASSVDMAKWMRFLLGHNPDVLESVSMKQAFEPFITFKNKNKYYQRWDGHVKSSYGFGWRIHEYQKTDAPDIETVWHHGGSVNNYRNEIAVYPGSDLGICVLLNGNSILARNVIPDLHAIVQKIYKEVTNTALAEKG